MKIPISLQSYGLSIAISAAGLLLLWWSGEPLLLLAPTSLVFFYGGRGPGLLSVAICGLGALLVLIGGMATAEPHALLRLAILVAIATVVGLLVQDWRTVRASAATLRSMLDNLEQEKERLRRAEQELRTTLDRIPALVLSAWPDGTVDFINAHWAEQGFHEPDLRRVTPVVHPDDLPSFEEKWRRSLATGEPYQVELRLRKASGEYRWHLARAVTLRDETGRIIKRYATATDIDDRKKTEEALRARERELQLIIDTVPTPIWVVAGDGVPAYMSKKLQAWYGLTIDDLEEVEGSKVKGAIRARVHPDDIVAVETNMLHAFETGEPFAMRYRHLRHDGLCRWVAGRAEPLRDENGRILKWFGVVIDIDDEKKAQDALRAAQEKLARAAQLASLAQLSASIAHEVNQPLAAVVANSQACQRWLSHDPPNIARARLSADRIVRGAMTAADVVSRVRELFTQKVLTRSFVNLNGVVGEAQELLIDLIAIEGVLFELDLDWTLPPASADRIQMQQVLINLIRNGIDAMKANIDVPKTLAVRSRRDGEGMIVIEVRDNGEGLAEPGRIFEPFFTTKDGGMGMGLAVCRSIVESHEGRLWAESIKPRGTAFSFSLPIQS